MCVRVRVRVRVLVSVCLCVNMCEYVWACVNMCGHVYVYVCLIMVCFGGFWAWVSLLVAFVSCLFLCGGVCVRVRMCVFRV